MTSCPACGRASELPHQRFCRSCGAPLDPAEGSGSPAAASTAVGARPRRVTAGIAVPVLVAAVILALAVGGLLTMELRSRPTAAPVLPVTTSSPWTVPAPLPTPRPFSPTPSPTTPIPPTPTPPSPDPTDDQSVAELLTHIPDAIAPSCTPTSVPEAFGRPVAAVSCVPRGAKAPDTIQYWKFGSQRALRAAYSHVTNNIASDLSVRSGCTSPGRGSWGLGDFACYQTDNGVRLWWTKKGEPILALVMDQKMTTAQAWNWFLDTSTGPF